MTTQRGYFRPTTLKEANDQTVMAWSEAVLQSKIIELAVSLGWIYYHTHDSRRSPAGFPDLVLVHAGKKRILFRELKRTAGTVSRTQQQWILALIRSDGDAGLWTPDDWVSGRIERELRGIRP